METTNEKEAPQVEVEKSNGAAEAAPAEEAAPAAKSDKGAKAMVSAQIEDLMAAVKRLESFASEEAKRVSTKLVPVESKAKENFWVTMLIALGLGLIFGLLIGGGRRRD